MTRRVAILGSTGSIGVQALDLISRGDWTVTALSGARNHSRLAEQAKRFRPELTVTADPNCLGFLRDALAGTGLRVEGPDAIEEAAAVGSDGIVLNAIVGAAGLAPSLAAVRSGATLALANKESLVCAGELLTAEARRAGGTILPVDSEHSAIFQALRGEDISTVERIVITASGGAFRDWPIDRLRDATVADASSHPNWDMGQRITIDSASMFNKALEVIETREFFCVAPDMIEVVIHPESLVHALVGFQDGALIAHIGPHDMRHAIGHALDWPHRHALPVERLDLAKAGTLSFHSPDERRWPALRLAREVMAIRGHAGAVFNAAKEAALDGFIGGRVRFDEMADIVSRTLEWALRTHDISLPVSSLESAMRFDDLARRHAATLVGRTA